MVSRLSNLLVAGLLLAPACATSRVDEHWGEAYEHSVEHMTANPDAELENPEAPKGLDPVTGEQVIGKYEREQGRSKTPQQAPSIVQVSTGN